MTRECCEIMEVENIAVLCHERLEGVYLEELRQEIMKVLKAVITQRYCRIKKMLEGVMKAR